jgi:PrgI family protein
MQFKVPQFLEIEDKIFGPFTFREFIYLAGGAGLCYILYKLLGFLLGLVPILLIAGLALALTFYKPNNKPFINMIQSWFGYIVQDKLYIWKRRKSKEGQKELNEGKINNNTRESLENSSKLGGNKLRDLAWSLDVLDLNKPQ